MEKVYNRGDIIIKEGEQGETLYLLKSGRVGILKGDRLVAVREPGVIFGEMGVLLGQPRSATVKALTPCVVEAYEGDINALLEDHPQMTKLILRTLAERLVEATTKLHRCVLNESEHKTGTSGSSGVSFEDLAAIDNPVIERVVECVSNNVLVAALLGTTPRVRKKFFSNMSRGKANTIKEDMYVAISFLTQGAVESARLCILKELEQIQRHGRKDSLGEGRDRIKDEDKTREQLITELVELRQRVAELEYQEQFRESSSLKVGEILVKMGYVTEQQLGEALKRQEEMTGLGKREKLLSIMVDWGIITEVQLETILAIQSARVSIR